MSEITVYPKVTNISYFPVGICITGQLFVLLGRYLKEENGFYAYFQLNDDQTFSIFRDHTSFNPIVPTNTYIAEITYDIPTIVPSLTGSFSMNFNTRSRLTFFIGTKVWSSITVMVILYSVHCNSTCVWLFDLSFFFVGLVSSGWKNLWLQCTTGHSCQKWKLAHWFCHAGKPF